MSLPNSRRSRHQWQTSLSLALLFSTPIFAESSKRGLAYIGEAHAPDTKLLSSGNSPLSWYYNWGPHPNNNIDASKLEFLPMIHGLDAVKDSNTARVIGNCPSSSTHLLSFNEPDGTQDSGGSKISAKDAAKAYIDYVVPFRDGNRKWKISHPVTTGSGMGLEWLRSFNESCYELAPETGCPNDFIAAHWYGNLDGLKNWLGSLNDFYNSGDNEPLKIWITELALPQADNDVTAAMLNQTIPYLDQLDYVERYSWFGAFRAKNANEWTGDGVALFDNHGGLTEVGALYMGDGFKKGQKGEGSDSAASVSRVGWRTLLGLGAVGLVFGAM